MQLTAGKEEAEEKAEQITEDLQCESLTLYFYLCSIGCMLSIWLLFVEAMTTGIKPVLDCIGFEPSEGREQLPGDLPPRSIMDQCWMAWSDFKEFTHSAVYGAIIHVLG
jgi:hypothetical protein